MIIYTCVTNGYDKFSDDHYYDPSVRYVAFTDGTVDVPEKWEEYPIKVEEECPRRRSAHPKICPHLYFDAGESVVWIDGCYVITKEFVETSKRILSRSSQTHMIHPCRFNFVEEVMEGYVSSFNTKAQMVEIMEALMELNYNFKNYCSPVLASIWRHITPEISKFGDLWWKYSLIGPNRDQISFDTARQLTALPWQTIKNPLKDHWPEVGIDFDHRTGKLNRLGKHPQAGDLEQYKRENEMLKEIGRCTRMIARLHYKHNFQSMIDANVLNR
jgi:hypothetical protein